MTTQTEATLLTQIREWASDSGAIFYSLRGKHGTFLIFPEDVAGRTDQELVDFIIARCAA